MGGRTERWRIGDLFLEVLALGMSYEEWSLVVLTHSILLRRPQSLALTLTYPSITTTLPPFSSHHILPFRQPFSVSKAYPRCFQQLCGVEEWKVVRCHDDIHESQHSHTHTLDARSLVLSLARFAQPLSFANKMSWSISLSLPSIPHVLLVVPAPSAS